MRRTKPELFYGMIGLEVVKISGKPFKSGSKINSVTGIVTNEEDPEKREGFTFEEDDSIVNCEMCELPTED